MYGVMLTKVIEAIDHTVGRKRTPSEEWDAFAESVFNPEAYAKRLQKEREREDLKWKLIGGITAIAAAGEVYHVAKRARILDRLKK